MNKIKTWLRNLLSEAKPLVRQTASVALAIPDVLIPGLLLIALFYMLSSLGAAYAWPAGVGSLLNLIESIAAMPVAAAIITYAAAASWEKRGAKLIDAYHLARIRIKEIVITGVVAGLIVLAVNWFASMFYSLIGVIPALLGWIPVIGPVITALISAVFQLISLAMEFIAHIALVAGMLSLTADGITGRPQLERVLNILRGAAGNRGLHQLAAIFAAWIIVHAACAVLSLTGSIGLLTGSLLQALLTAVSMIAVSVVYLQERDSQDGMRFHA